VVAKRQATRPSLSRRILQWSIAKRVHSPEVWPYFHQQHRLSAALEKNWAAVNELLDYAIKDTAQGNRRDVKLDDTFYLAATSREEHIPILEKIWTFTNRSIAKDICNFSLYQATVLNKDSTVDWLLNSCNANPNTSAERPHSFERSRKFRERFYGQSLDSKGR
jgi:hypothetical protein